MGSKNWKVKLTKSRIHDQLWEAMDWLDEQEKLHPNFSKVEIVYNFDLEYVATIHYEEEDPSGDLFKSA